MMTPTPGDSDERFEMGVESGDRVTVVRFRGSPTLEQSELLRDELLVLTDDPPPCLVVDLTDLHFINSVGLGALVTAHVRCQRRGRQMRLAGPPASIRQMLQLTRLTDLFRVYDSMDQALSAA